MLLGFASGLLFLVNSSFATPNQRTRSKVLSSTGPCQIEAEPVLERPCTRGLKIRIKLDMRISSTRVSRFSSSMAKQTRCCEVRTTKRRSKQSAGTRMLRTETSVGSFRTDADSLIRDMTSPLARHSRAYSASNEIQVMDLACTTRMYKSQ